MAISAMTTCQAVVLNPEGLHLRPASIIAQSAQKYDCSIWLEKDDFKADAKSIINILSLDASCGAKLKISAEGADESKAVAEIANLCETQFNSV